MFCFWNRWYLYRGFRLPVANVIFTVGPIYNRSSDAEALLKNAYRSLWCFLIWRFGYCADISVPQWIICVVNGIDYRNSLRVAKENNIQYIAFPAISCGTFGLVDGSEYMNKYFCSTSLIRFSKIYVTLKEIAKLRCCSLNNSIQLCPIISS